MEDRLRTIAEERAYLDLENALHDLKRLVDINALKIALIPPEWRTAEKDFPVKPKKEKLTISLDADMVRWFRRMGQGYQTRVNGVLRAFMLAVISKEIESHGDRDWKGDLMRERKRP